MKATHILLFAAFALAQTARGQLIDNVDELDAAESAKPSPASGLMQRPEGTPAPVKVAPTAASPVAPSPPPSKVKDKPKNTSTNGSSEPIAWECDSARGEKNKGFLELIGNVLVTQADLRIESSKAIVYFGVNDKEVKKIIASGNVKMTKIDPETDQKIRAESNEVTFLNPERHLIMQGNARLWRGQDLMKSKQITYDMNSGLIKADRVEGVVQPSTLPEGKK